MCFDKFCVARAQAPTDEYVTEVVVARLSRPDVLDLLAAQPESETSGTAARLTALRNDYRKYEALAMAGKLPADSGTRILAGLHEQIEALQKQLQPKCLPRALTDIAGVPDVRAHWERLSMPQRREVIRALLVPRILRAGKGSQRFDPDYVHIEWHEGTR
jgi:hypothetical protein